MGRACLPFVWCFHPYELCAREDDGARNGIKNETVEALRENIQRMTHEFGLRPANLDTCEPLFGARP